jgi:Rrf2 family transcriptional regulator, iron-sulfur cluster assembly transcription factor
MLISTRSRYALRVLARMADGDREFPRSLAVLSVQERVSVRYLEQIFGKLRSSGLVKGKRGPGGGYVLGRPPDRISLYEVVSVLETEFLPASCISEGGECFTGPNARTDEFLCPLEQSCVTRPLWLRLRAMYYQFMKEHTIEDLAHGRL